MKTKKLFKFLGVILPIILFLFLITIINTAKFSKFESWVYEESIEGMSHGLTFFMKLITYIGNASSIIIFCLILFCFSKTRKTFAPLISLSVVTATLSNIILKNIFARERPNILRIINETDYSFPSGHSMISMAMFSMVALLSNKYVKDKTLKILVIISCAILTFSIGISRIYLGVHYAGDVIGGWLIGFSISILIYILCFKTKRY